MATPLNRFYVSPDDDLDAMARKIPDMLRSMEPGDSLSFRRLDDDDGGDFEVILEAATTRVLDA